MRTTRLLISGAMTGAVLALHPTGALAQGALMGGVEECAGPTLDHGSCNLVFRNQMGLNTLSVAELNETVFASCPNFPNGPYRRVDAPNETDIDYVTLELSTPTTGDDLSAAAINDQIGTDVITGVSVTVTGTFSNKDANVTVTQDFPDDRSQILDLPGFDYILFEKSQGGGQVGTLVCDLNMWFRTGGAGAPQFGLESFPIDHGVNQITIGWVAGPSGLKSQSDAKAACELAGNDDPPPDADLEKKVSYLVGVYKVTTEDLASPSNVTGCGLDDDGDPVIAGYCDPTEAAGGGGLLTRPNSCNPDGQSGGVPEANVAGVNGSASTCYFTSRGTTYSFAC